MRGRVLPVARQSYLKSFDPRLTQNLQYYGVDVGPTESSRAGYFFLMILVTEIYAVTLGQAVAALSPSIVIAALL